jgi:pyroglutamyl-peptidase
VLSWLAEVIWVPILLLTGYEPFDGFSLNPSEEIVKTLGNTKVGQYDVHGLVLPLDYTKAFELLVSKMDEIGPSFVLCTGQASRGAVTIERIAVNAQSTLKEDNYGNKPESDVIIPGAPAAYFSSVDPQPIVDLLQKQGIPAQVSYHAGTYGCNWILFQVLHRIARDNLSTQATFVHVPPLPEQAIEKNRADLPNMLLSEELRAIELIIGEL